MSPPSTEELVKKIQELEARNAELRYQLSLFNPSGGSHHHDHTPCSAHRNGSCGPRKAPEISWGCEFSEEQYFNLVETLGQAIHILGPKGRVLYWNHAAEKLYGFTEEEALGKGIYELIVDDRDFGAAEIIINGVLSGQLWAGQFPIVTKTGETVPANCTLAPFYDDDGTIIGAACVGGDARAFTEIKIPIMDTKGFQTGQTSGRHTNSCVTRFDRDSEQSFQTSVASKLTNLASKVSNKVRSKLKSGDGNAVGEGGSGANTPRGEPPCEVFSPSAAGKSPKISQRDASFRSEGKTAIDKFTYKAQAWIDETAMQWSGRGTEYESSESEVSNRFGWSSVHIEEIFDHPDHAAEPEIHAGESNQLVVLEGSGSWSSFIVNSPKPSIAESGSSHGSNSVEDRLAETHSAHYKIMWEDLTIG